MDEEIDWAREDFIAAAQDVFSEPEKRHYFPERDDRYKDLGNHGRQTLKGPDPDRLE